MLAPRREESAAFHLTPWAKSFKYAAPFTTPDPLTLHKLLAGVHDRGGQAAVVEASSSGIGHHSLDFIDYKVAVFTNCGQYDNDAVPDDLPSIAMLAADSPEAEAFAAEAQRKRDEERYSESLLRLFDNLVDPDVQRAVVNLDDPRAQLFIDRATPCDVVTYSLSNSGATVWLERLVGNIWDTELIIVTPQGRLQIITPLLGTHNASNVLAAVATGIALDVPLASIVAGIEAVEVIPGRSEIIDEGQPFSVVVDAASTPEQLQCMLDALRAGGAKRIFTVLGCEGGVAPERRSLRAKSGQVADAQSDVLILTNLHPRNEPPSEVVSDIVSGLPREKTLRFESWPFYPFQVRGQGSTHACAGMRTHAHSNTQAEACLDMRS